MPRFHYTYLLHQDLEMLFQDLDAISMYNGIWACSSILHLPKIEQFPVFQKMCNALKENSVIYTSFKIW